MFGQNNSGQNYQAVGGKPPKEVIPRIDKSISEDYYENINNKDKLNIVFNASSGIRISMPTPPCISIRQIIRNFIQKLGLGEKVLESDIIFIHNAEIIDVNDQRPLSDLFKNNSIIIVIDVKGVIAA